MSDYLILYSPPSYAKPTWTLAPPKMALGAESPEGAIGQVYGDTLGSFLAIDLDDLTVYTRKTTLEPAHGGS